MTYSGLVGWPWGMRRRWRRRRRRIGKGGGEGLHRLWLHNWIQEASSIMPAWPDMGGVLLILRVEHSYHTKHITQGWELRSMEFEMATRKLSDRQFLTALVYWRMKVQQEVKSIQQSTDDTFWSITCNSGKCGAHIINELRSKAY